jgi:rhodanese-related sulfurtransferase/ribosomal protein S18 acetylase RimI-like enzyme
MVIRDAYPHELAEIGELRLAAYRADGFLAPDSVYAPRLRELGSDGLGAVLVAVGSHGGPPLGTVMLQSWPNAGHVVHGPGEGEIRALAVRPEARGAGVGRALLGAVIDRAAREGIGHLLLCTQPDMKAAQHLYEEAGFSRMPERDWSPEPADPLLAYGMLLPARQHGRPSRANYRAASTPGERRGAVMANGIPEVPATAVPDGAWLLDVREMDEWQAGHVPEATHIPLGQLGARTAELPVDQEIYVICRSGARSARAAQALNGAGWQAINVGGGMQDWAAAGKPMTADSGAEPFVA